MIEVIKKTISSTLLYEYQSIILFGSRARGTNRLKSDYDILIVLKDEVTEKEKIKITTKIRKSLAQKDIDADILVKTKNEIDYFKNKMGSVVNIAIKEGVVLIKAKEFLEK